MSFNLGFETIEEAKKLGYIPCIIKRLDDGGLFLLNQDKESYSLEKSNVKLNIKGIALFQKHFKIMAWVKNLNAEDYFKKYG